MCFGRGNSTVCGHCEVCLGNYGKRRYDNSTGLYFGFLFFSFGGMGLNSGLHACETGTLSVESQLQPFLLWLFWR
jgi:hypothetical protein